LVELFSIGNAWRDFLDLEGEFLQALAYVPLRPQHLTVWSHKFGKILDQVGSAVDSFLWVAVKEGELFKNNKLRNKEKLNIWDYCRIVETVYQLSSANVVARDGPVNHGPITPFAVFGNMLISKQKTEWWWTAYQSYKHNRYSESAEATLDNTLQALAGLFLLNVLHKENQRWLVEEEVIAWEFPMNPIMLSRNLLGSKFGSTLPSVRARSELFLHEFRVDRKAAGFS
jgi:hypothetical protein